MPGQDTDQRAAVENPSERPNTTDIPGGVDLSAYNIDVSEPFGYGAGQDAPGPTTVMDPTTGYAVSSNPMGEGAGDQRVADVQRLLITELDEEGATDQPSGVLPGYGVDGIWRCETQTAYNQLLKEKGIEPCNTSAGKSSVNCNGVNTPACAMDEETLEKLKEAKTNEQEEEQEEEEQPQEEELPKFDDQCFLITNIKEVFEKSEPPAVGATFHELPQAPLTDRTKIK